MDCNTDVIRVLESRQCKSKELTEAVQSMIKANCEVLGELEPTREIAIEMQQSLLDIWGYTTGIIDLLRVILEETNHPFIGTHMASFAKLMSALRTLLKMHLVALQGVEDLKRKVLEFSFSDNFTLLLCLGFDVQNGQNLRVDQTHRL